MLLFGNFKESSEECWLHVKLHNPILSLIPQLPFSIGDEKNFQVLEEKMGALGSAFCGAARSPVAEQRETREKGLALIQFWVQRKLAVSLIQAPSSVRSPND